GDGKVESVILQTLESRPLGATHWSTRSMARHSGISTSSVIWRAFGLQPHRLETFKLSTDPLFVAKVRDVVGLYLNPPDHALVRCVDEKSQIQALDRTQPLLPMRPGQAERRSHDYKRHGTTSLFAALDIATGRVIGRCYQRHRAVEFRNFLAQVEQAVPADLDIHLVLDNYATHRRRRSRSGSPATRAVTCTSRRPAPPGSIRSNAGSRCSPTSRSSAASIAVSNTSRPTSPLSFRPTMPSPSRFRLDQER